jgi:hypothetical protein
MKHKDKLGILTAAIIVGSQIGGPLGASAPTAQQLSQIDTVLSAGSVDALNAFISHNPNLFDGNVGKALDNTSAARMEGLQRYAFAVPNERAREKANENAAFNRIY